jgi:Ser/Thr protein kinase RdoA (MazF antagonist)
VKVAYPHQNHYLLPMTTEIKNQIHRLVKIFCLDAVVSSIEEISGGCINLLWKVNTSTGSFAVKLLNPIYAKNPDVRKNYKIAEKISQMFQDRGFPSVPAVHHNDNPLLDLDDDTFMLYLWIDGIVITPGEASNKQCYLIGQMTASLHSANLTIDHPVKPQVRLFDESFWQNIIAQGEKQNQFWTSDIKAMLPLLIKSYEKGEQEKSKLLYEQVITHRDINLKNIIWQDDRSYKIIDWEAAGFANPVVELLETAFELSGQWEGVLDQEKYEAVLRGYHSSDRNNETDFDCALSGCFGCRLEWLEFNLQRSLNTNLSDTEKKLAGNEIKTATMAINMLELNTEKFKVWYLNVLSAK